MLFNSIDFILFLPIVIISYYLIPAKYRWVLLLGASYYFYMCWKLEYIVLIILSTLIDYYCGIQMGKKESRKAKRPFLLLSLISNLGILFSFKYFNFFTENVNALFAYFDVSAQLPIVDLLLPVGISFYTFQTLSYSIDVYLDKQTPEPHLGYFALYVSFFPQLVAGPIERFSRLTPQLKQKHVFNYDHLKNGLRLILFGLFTKMVIADNIGPIVDAVYKEPEIYSSNNILTAIVFYSFQIYCDFFGYSLIAIGSAKLMGIELMDNFKTPYLATNIANFWQRWHISLSTWFRDYVYFPLGGNRTKIWRWGLNIFVVFVLSGFWHGANVTFLMWGLIFAVFYLIESLINKAFHLKTEFKAYSVKHFVLALKTFIVVAFAWIFFRSTGMDHAWLVIDSLFKNYSLEGSELNITSAIWIFFICFILVDIILYKSRFDSWVDKFPFVMRWSIYTLLIFSIVVFAGVDDLPFIYFQF